MPPGMGFVTLRFRFCLRFCGDGRGCPCPQGGSIWETVKQSKTGETQSTESIRVYVCFQSPRKMGIRGSVFLRNRVFGVLPFPRNMSGEMQA